MACQTLLPNIPALFCCPGGRQRLYDTIALRAITYGFAAKHVAGEPYNVYRDCVISYSLSGVYFHGFDATTPIVGTMSIFSTITLDDDAYNVGFTRQIEQDAGWTQDGNFALQNISGVVSDIRQSATQWTTIWEFFAAFVGRGQISATYEIGGPINVQQITAPLFQAVDDYQLSSEPVSQGILKGFHPTARDIYSEPADLYHPGTAAPADGAFIEVESNQTFASLSTGSNGRLTDGTYAPPVFGNRAEPLCLGYGVVACKSKLWNLSRICEVRKLSRHQPQTNTDEFCGIIGGSAEDNAQGIIITRPAMQAGETDFITGGYDGFTRARIINYEDPFYGTTPNPACCGFPP